MAHLEIYDSDVTDSGVYTCAAKNIAGSVTTNSTITIKGITIKLLKYISELRAILHVQFCFSKIK